jgi:hypothetical protein
MATDDQEILKPMEVQSGELAPGKPDNRSNMQEFQEDFIPDPDEYEQLYEQYQGQGVKTWTGFLNWFKKDSKKKI